MTPPAAARRVVGVDELVGLDPDDRQGEPRRRHLRPAARPPPAAHSPASPSTTGAAARDARPGLRHEIVEPDPEHAGHERREQRRARSPSTCQAYIAKPLFRCNDGTNNCFHEPESRAGTIGERMADVPKRLITSRRLPSRSSGRTCAPGVGSDRSAKICEATSRALQLCSDAAVSRSSSSSGTAS